MHEMGIAMQIVEIATASIPSEMAGAKVARVNLKIGKLTAVVPTSLRFCFEIVAQDTALAAAELNIQEMPIVARCRACRCEWTLTEPVFACRQCRSAEVDVISGRELDIESIELAEEEGPNAEQML